MWRTTQKWVCKILDIVIPLSPINRITGFNLIKVFHFRTEKYRVFMSRYWIFYSFPFDISTRIVWFFRIAFNIRRQGILSKIVKPHIKKKTERQTVCYSKGFNYLNLSLKIVIQFIISILKPLFKLIFSLSLYLYKIAEVKQHRA